MAIREVRLTAPYTMGVVTNLRKIRTITELLGIDIDFLHENSEFKTDFITESNDNRNLLMFSLKQKYLKIFDQYQITVLDGKAQHLELRASNYKSDDLKNLIESIVGEYGHDENNQGIADWNNLKYMTWWFKNDKHEQTFYEPTSTDDIYYGIMIDGMNEKFIVLSLIDYSNIDSKLNCKNWLQQ